MEFNIRQYGNMLAEKNINLIYSGPIWAGGIDGMAEMLMTRLTFDELDESASQSVFSVFVEQMNNMLMYSAEKEYFNRSKGIERESSKGTFILGYKNSGYFIQTGNIVTDKNAEILKQRIDHLNYLDKKELRQFYKQQIRAVDDNLTSQGAGIGLTEIARRSSEPIKYEFETLGNELQYFSMYISIRKGGRE